MSTLLLNSSLAMKCKYLFKLVCLLQPLSLTLFLKIQLCIINSYVHYSPNHSLFSCRYNNVLFFRFDPFTGSVIIFSTIFMALLFIFYFQESKFAIFLYPGVVYVDRGLLPMTVVERDAGEFGKHPTLVGFSGHKVKTLLMANVLKSLTVYVNKIFSIVIKWSIFFLHLP